MDKVFQKIKDISKSIAIIFLYFVLNTFLVAIFYKYIKSSNLFIANFINILIDLIVLFTYILIYRKCIFKDVKDFKVNGKKYIKDNFNVYILSYIIMIIINVILMNTIGMPNNEAGNREILTKYPYFAVISMIITGPIVEELMVRKNLRDVVNNKYLYIVLSGLVFGLLHMAVASSLKELLFVISYGVLGSCFAIMYYKTDNIFTSIFFHSMHNLIAVLFLLV